MSGGVNTLAKSAVFALMAVAMPFAIDIRGGLSGSEVVSLGVLLAGSVVVFFKKNTPSNPAAVAVVALGATVVNAVTAAWTDGVITNEEWATIALAFLGSLSTYLTGNDTAALSAATTPAQATVRPAGGVA